MKRNSLKCVAGRSEDQARFLSASYDDSEIKEYLESKKELILLPYDFPRLKQRKVQQESLSISFFPKYYHSLKECLVKAQGDFFTLSLVAFQALLYRYGNKESFFTPVSFQDYTKKENVTILYSFILESSFDSNSNGFSTIETTNEALFKGFQKNSFYDALRKKLKEEKYKEHPLNQILFRFEKKERLIEQSQIPTQFTVNCYKNQHLTELAFHIKDYGIHAQLEVIYNSNLFRESTIKRMLKHYELLLKELAEYPAKPIYQLEMMTHEEKQQILIDWNNTQKDYPTDKTLHQLFEEQVIKRPNNIAVIFEDQKLTYQELNDKANQLAHYLRDQGVTPDMLVVIACERSVEMIIGILGILKAGGAYVPVDPSYPLDRIQFMLEDTQATLLLTQQTVLERLPTTQEKVFLLDRDREKLIHYPITNPSCTTHPRNLAYTIYTSGSTGKPKGVMIEHQSICDRLFWYQSYTPLSYEDRFLHQLSFSFDAAVMALWWPLVSGAQVIIPSILGDVELLAELVTSHKVTTLHSVPTAIKSLLEHILSQRKNLTYLCRIIVGGEVFSKDLYEKTAFLSKCKIYNAYGPTESSVISTNYDATDQEVRALTVPIGTPVANTQVYILDETLNPVAIGVSGELYIGGKGLARGYLNQKELTIQRFVKNPFQSEEEKIHGRNSRLYRTGDLCRWLEDGNIEYIGRIDDQVKFRGFRIELEEIRAVLLRHPKIKEAILVIRENTYGHQRLIGYLLLKKVKEHQKTTIKVGELQTYLQTILPDYMIPSALIILESIPLTANGKLDKKSLPDPELRDSNSYISPRNELEDKICQVWSEALGLAKGEVGIKDDFFRLGGDSIVTIQIVSKLRQRFKIFISVKDIFKYRTIGRLYDEVLSKQNVDKNIDIKTEQGLLKGDVPLLPIQQWFFDNNFAVPNYWNQTFTIKSSNLDLGKLKSSIIKLINYHDAFRFKYKKSKNGTCIQYYDSEAKIEELKLLDIRTLGAEEGSKKFETKLQQILASWQSNFNLEKGPIYNIAYIYGYKDGTSRVCFALHHLAIDSVSWRVLSEDLKYLYEGKDLGSKGSSYRQWVNAVYGYANFHVDEKNYWLNIIKDFENRKNNTFDKLVVEGNTRSYSNLKLNKDYTKKLLQESNRAYNTEVNDLLLAALGYSLFEISGDNINYITLEGHGREEIDKTVDITKTMGWFTTMYPIRLEASKEISASIRNIKEHLRSIPNKGIGYGALFGYKKLPMIGFNYLGKFGNEQKNQSMKRVWSILSEGVMGEGSNDSIHSENQDNYIININGWVTNDCNLQFTIQSKLSNEITNRLAEVFKKNLENIIDYTTQLNRNYLTVSDIDSVINQEYLDRLQESKEIEAIYIANDTQYEFFFYELKNRDVSDIFIIQTIWQYHCKVNVNRLKEAWNYAQAKFSVLRLRLLLEEKLLQIIDKEGELDWRYIDLSQELDVVAQENKIKDIQEQDRFESYKLEQGNLFRVYLIKQKEDLYTCIYSAHHTIMDGWSSYNLFWYMHDVYIKLQNNEKVFLSTDNTYKDSQKYLQEHQNDNILYWKEYIKKIKGADDLRWLLKNSRKNLKHLRYRRTNNPHELRLVLKDSLYKKLREISLKEGVTLNSILQYAWHKTLNIHANTDQTIVGVVMSSRNLPVDNIENSVGLHMNTLPLVLHHNKNEEDENIIELIKTIQRNIEDINSRCNINLTKLQNKRRRLFNNIFMYEYNDSPINEEHQTKLKIKFKDIIDPVADYPLVAMGHEENNKLLFIIKYEGELFNRNKIQELLSTVKIILENIGLGEKYLLN